MANRLEVAPEALDGHARECLKIARTYGYKLFVEQGTPNKYYLVPAGAALNDDPPAEIRLKQAGSKPIKNPLEITPPNLTNKPNDLEDNLDKVVRDEMDLKQYDGRWGSYIYGPAGHNAGWMSGAARKVHKLDDGTSVDGEDGEGWTDLSAGGCGAITMATIMMNLMRQKGFSPPRDASRKDAQWDEVKDVTDWMGATTKHGRVKGSGTGQGLIDMRDFQEKWPGFSLKKYFTVPQVIAALKTDSFIILNGAFGVFNSMPAAKTSLPDKFYKAHNIVLWSAGTNPHGFDYIRIFDPGGGGRYLLADHLLKGGYNDKNDKLKVCGGQYWEPYRVVLYPRGASSFADGITGAPSRF